MGSGCCVMDNPIGNLARGIGDALHDLFCSDCCVGYSPSRSDSDEHAKKIAEELAEMTKRSDEATEHTVEEVLSYLKSDIERLFKDLKSFNTKNYGGKKLNIDFRSIEQENKEMETCAKTLVGDMMRDRLVLTDPELALILEEKDDKKRAKRFADFESKLRKAAKDALIKEIESIVRKQQDVISSAIEKRLNELNGSVQRSDEAFQKILALKESDEPALEAQKMQYIYQCGVCDLLLNEMDDREAIS